MQNFQSICFVFTGLLQLQFVEPFCVYRTLEEISGQSPDFYTFYFFAFDEYLNSFPDCTPLLNSAYPFMQFVVFPTPLVPISYTFNFQTFKNVRSVIEPVTVIERPVTKLSLQHFDVLVQPSCKSYYPEISNFDLNNMYPDYSTYTNPQFRDLKRLTKKLYNSVMIDLYGLLKFPTFFDVPQTLLLFVRTCNSPLFLHVLYMKRLAIPSIATVSADIGQLSVVRYGAEVPLESVSPVWDYLNPLQINRLFNFKIGNIPASQKIVPVYHESVPYAIVKFAPENCLKPKITFSSVCSPELMSILTLVNQVHNSTSNLITIDDSIQTPNRSNYFFWNQPAIIPYRMKITEWMRRESYSNPRMKDKSLQHRFTTTLKILYFDCIRLIYCKPKIKDDDPDFTAWVNPFHQHLWLLGSFMALVDLITKLSSSSFLQLLTFREITKQQLLRVYLFVALFVGMMIRSYYENEITSLVVAPRHKTVGTNLSEIFSESYEILWTSNGAIGQADREIEPRWPRYQFTRDFMREKIDRLIERKNPFKRVDLYDKFEKHIVEYLTQKFMYPIMQSTLDLEYSIIGHIMHIVKFDCHVTTVKFYNTKFAYRIALVNRHWYMVSFLWIEQSGLLGKWKDWSAFAEKLKRRLSKKRNMDLENVSLEGADLIGLKKVMAAMAVFGGLMLATFIIFLAEVVYIQFQGRLSCFSLKTKVSSYY